MPYVIRNGSGEVVVVCENQIPDSEFLAAGSDDLTFFYEKIDKFTELDDKFESLNKSVTVDTYEWDLSGQYSFCFFSELTSAIEVGAIDVDLCDATGTMRTYTVADATTLLDELSTYKHSLLNNYHSLFSAIESSTDLTELNAVDIESGWPVAP